MMLFKLSIQNLHKSLKDYTIYFATLIIGVAIFYVFNSMEKQTIMMKTSSATYGVIKLMNSTMAAISVFVAFVLGCLIVYASNFLMKRRKKEFGIYMLLGMEKGRIARIIMTETHYYRSGFPGTGPDGGDHCFTGNEYSGRKAF